MSAYISEINKIREQAIYIGTETQKAETKEKAKIFYRLLKDSDIPYIAAKHASDPKTIYNLTFDSLYILGYYNLPFAVAFSQHQHLLATMVTFPLENNPTLNEKRNFIINEIVTNKLLMTVSNFDNLISTTDNEQNLTNAKWDGTQYIVNGKKSFQSMVSDADLILFSAAVGETGLGLFITQLKENPNIKIGEPLFNDVMADTDTRSIVFNNMVLSEEHVLEVSHELASDNNAMKMVDMSECWWHVFIVAPYLGVAGRSIEEVRLFSHSARVQDDTCLAQLDGNIVNAGQLGIKLQASITLASGFANMINLVLTENSDTLFKELVDMTASIKYTCMENAEFIVNKARKIIGTRAMSSKNIMSTLSQQINYASLHPALSAHIERYIGRKTLSEKKFMGLYDFAQDYT